MSARNLAPPLKDWSELDHALEVLACGSNPIDVRLLTSHALDE
jgi:hypothetical protein